MIQTRDDEIYNNLKTSIGFHRSGDHLNFVRHFGEPHHLFGSYTGIKTSDYAAIPVTREDHLEAEKDKSGFAIRNLHKLFSILIKRVEQLEAEVEDLADMIEEYQPRFNHKEAIKKIDYKFLDW